MAAVPYQGVQNNNPSSGNGSELLDVSLVDVTWDIKAVAIPQSLYVVGAGDVKFTGANGVIDTWTVAAKTFIPVRVVKVFSSGTTATGIHAIY